MFSLRENVGPFYLSASFAVCDVEAFLLKTSAQGFHMLCVAGFDDAMDGDFGDIVAGESAVVGDVEDAGAFFGDDAGEEG